MAPIYSCHSFDIEVSRIAIAFWDEELCQPVIQQAIIYSCQLRYGLVVPLKTNLYLPGKIFSLLMTNFSSSMNLSEHCDRISHWVPCK